MTVINIKDMVQDQSTSIRQHLHQIADMLVINGILLENSGLLYGKMGIVVFFFHYARFTGDNSFENQAMVLMDSIVEQIQQQGIDYANGLAGIGTGIEYLSQNGFLENDTDEILEDFDNRIRQEIMYRQQENNSLDSGLCGLGQYLLYRVNNRRCRTGEICLLTNKEWLVHLVNILENEKNRSNNMPDILSFLCRLYSLDICNPKIDRYLDRTVKDLPLHDPAGECLPAWVLSLLRLASIRHQTADLAEQYARTLQLMASVATLPAHSPDITDRLLWLLQCKRLMTQAGINSDLACRLDTMTDQAFKQCEGIWFEKGKLSLKGCAGVGMAMMTTSEHCDDTWLDLLG